MGFPRGALKQRQQIIDGYLNDTGRNIFVPGEFLEWLAERPDHPCHAVFYSQSDADAAMEHRKEMVRRWVSGLRIKVTAQDVTGPERTIRVTVREMPAMMSPTGLRRDGGGYVRTNPDDPAHMAELAIQAAAALESWRERFGVVAEMRGCDLTAITGILGGLRAESIASAA